MFSAASILSFNAWFFEVQKLGCSLTYLKAQFCIWRTLVKLPLPFVLAFVWFWHPPRRWAPCLAVPGSERIRKHSLWPAFTEPSISFASSPALCSFGDGSAVVHPRRRGAHEVGCQLDDELPRCLFSQARAGAAPRARAGAVPEGAVFVGTCLLPLPVLCRRRWKRVVWRHLPAERTPQVVQVAETTPGVERAGCQKVAEELRRRSEKVWGGFFCELFGAAGVRPLLGKETWEAGLIIPMFFCPLHNRMIWKKIFVILSFPLVAHAPHTKLAPHHSDDNGYS